MNQQMNTQFNQCPECETSNYDRRDFFKSISKSTLGTMGTAIALGEVASLTNLTEANAAESLLSPLDGKQGPKPSTRTANPAEEIVKELYTTLSDEQKKAVCLTFEDPKRLSVNPNRALNVVINKVYNSKQIELIQRIVKAISSGEEGYQKISRGGTWDASKSFGNCGANFFGDPIKGDYAFLFTGHHLTIRCDGNFKDCIAFGGPIYYGHTPNGYSDKNIFNYQTKQVMKVFDALDEKQRMKALITMGNPGEGKKSITLHPEQKDHPGVHIAELGEDQKGLIKEVMKAILSPFRSEDVDEVMAIIKKSGGMEKISLAFYNEGYEGEKTSKNQPWSFWRLEGPGFVWNYRVLPHVHTYVKIACS